MPLTERNANFRTSHTTYCTRTKPFRNGPTYIVLSDSENSSPPPRMATPNSQRLTAPSRTQSSNSNVRNMSPATSTPPSQRLTAPSNMQSRNSNVRNMSPATSTPPSNLPRSSLPRSSLPRSSLPRSNVPRSNLPRPPSRLPRSTRTGTPSRGSTIASTPRDSAVWLKSSPPETPIRPLNIRKVSSGSKSSQKKALPPLPAATLSRASSPAQASRTLLDAVERELSPSQFPTLSATPSRAVSASPSSPSGRGSDDKRSRLPRPSFFPEGRDSLTLGRPAPSPGRAYSPPAASYSTVRPVRNSAVSSASLASTPRKCVASSLEVRRTNGAKVVAIPAATKPLQAAEQPVPSQDGEDAVGMDEQAAPAPVVHRSAEQREERERGRKGFFASGKSAETRSKSKTRKVLEKMSGLVRKRASQVELAAGSRPTISGPLEGSFVHVDSSESRDEGSEAVPPVPALPAARPLIPDRAPPPPPMPASQPAISAPPGPSQANDLDPGLLENNEQERNVEETDLITASQHLRDMADRALTTEARASFLGFATAFTNARIFLAQANLAAERAQRSAQEALLHQGEARLSVMRLAEVARNLTAVAEGDGENSTTSQQPPAPPRPQMAGQRQGRTMGLRRKTLAEMEREARK